MKECRLLRSVFFTCILLFYMEGIASAAQIKVVRPSYGERGAYREAIVQQPLEIEVQSALSQQVRIRVFSGTFDTLKDNPHRKAQDGCWIYDSVVLTPSVAPHVNGTRMTFQPLPETWLGLGPMKEPSKRRYYFVFEVGDVLPEGPIKIESDLVKLYFAGGLNVTVKPRPTIPNITGLVKDIEKLWMERESVLANGPVHPLDGCARLAQVEEDGNLVIAFEDSCSEEKGNEAVVATGAPAARGQSSRHADGSLK